MKRFLLRRTSPATVIAMIALTVALGGTSYAAVVLPADSVGAKQLKNNTVTSLKVKNGSLLKADFKAGQIPSASAAFSGYENGPVSLPSSLATIATLNVPGASKYVIFAKAWLYDNVDMPVYTDCQLSAGNDTDETRTLLTGNGGTAVSGASVAFNVVHGFAAAGVAELKCDAFGVDVSANQIKITAIKVGNLTNTPI
ncbi:MAG: hypothetical protein ABSC51_04015 [Gaiellaceae bacterium]|jgi:hypothetical protein